MANQQLELKGGVDADPNGCLLFGLIAIAIGLLVLALAVSQVAKALGTADQPAKEAEIAH